MRWWSLFRARTNAAADAGLGGRAAPTDVAAHGGWIEDEATVLDHFHHQTRLVVETRLARARASQHDAAKRGVYGSIDFRFIRNISVNALAFGRGQHNVIAFHAGVPPILAALSRVVAAWDVIEADLGPGAEEPPQGCIEILLLLASGRRDAELERAVDQLLAEVEPLGERSILDRELLGAMLSFLTHHELAHIVRGHVDLLQLRKLPATILESTQAVESGGGRVRQWMELDADAWAISHLVAEAVPHHLRAHVSRADAQQRLRRLVLALGMVFMVLEPVPRSPLEAASSDHPYTPLRLAHAVELAVRGLVELSGGNEQALTAAVTPALEDLAEIHILAGRDLVGRLKDERDFITRELATIATAGPPDEINRALKRLEARVATR